MKKLYAREMDSPIGRLLVVSGEDGSLVEILFESEPREPLERKWLARSFQVSADSTRGQQAVNQLHDYFEGRRRKFELELAAHGTDFQRTVWQALMEIPFGETRTYKEIAERIGKPRAVRAVGAANGQNPIPVVVPCHRVIGSNGKLTGYAGGLGIKQKLLELEGVEQPSLLASF